MTGRRRIRVEISSADLPGHLEMCSVSAVDLVERRIATAASICAIEWPASNAATRWKRRFRRAGQECGERYQGYAFGFGLERSAMLRHDVSQIRLFYEADLRVLEQL